MKRKKNSAGPAPAPVPKAAPIQREGPSSWDIAQVCLFSVLLFLSMTVQTGQMSVILPVLAVALSIGPGPLRRLRERFCVPALGFVLFAVVSGFAAIYARFGEYAIKEYYKLIAAFSLAVIALVRFDKRHVRSLLWGIAAVCAAISLICTDAAVDGALFQGFCGVVDRLGGSFAGVDQNTWNTRVTGIYNDANITAGLLALGAFCGLHLSLTGKRWWERALACVLTGVSGMGFFLAMSRGGILCFGLALLVYLAGVGKAERTRLFFLIAFNMAVTVGLSIPAASGIANGALLPDLLTLGCGLPVWVLYEFPGRWIAKKLEGHGIAVATAVGALILATGVYGAAALRTTGPYTLGAGGYLFRTVELPAGDYTLDVEHSGELRIQIVHRLEDGTSESLASGPVEEISFTLTELSNLTVQFWGDPGETLESAAFSDGTEIPLDYPLLPGFLVNRLQSSLFGSSSFTGRVQYLRDGWELFKQAPLLGQGMGSTEGTLTSVQPYYYESLFLHNHVLQVMCDCGLLGAVPFVVFLLGVLWLLLRRLWEEREPLAAMLLGCWVMANVHGLMELNFSIRAYQCTVFLLLLMPVILYARPIVKENALWTCGLGFAIVLWLYLGAFAVLMESHRMAEREADAYEPEDAAEFMENTQRWIGMDVFDQEQNKLNFVGNSVILGDPAYYDDMVRYAKDLRATGTYSACTGLAEYYYLPQGQLSEVFACSREAVAQEASSKDAWNQQVEFYRYTVLYEIDPESDAGTFIKGVASLAEYLETYSQGRQEEIALTEENRTFLDRAVQARANGLEGEAALLYLMLPMGEENAAG